MKRDRNASGTAVAGEAGTQSAVSWEAAIAHSPLALALLDAETLDIRYLSDGFRDLIGAGMDETRGQPLPQRVRATLATARESGLPAHATDVAYEHPAFGSVLLDCSAWPFHDPRKGEDGLALHVAVQTGGAVKRERRSVLADQIRAANGKLLLAGLRQLELAEQASDHARRLDDLLGSHAGGVLVLESTGEVLLINSAALQMLALPAAGNPELAERLRALDLRRPSGEALAAADSPFERVFRGERFADLELDLFRPDGNVVRLSFTGTANQDAQPDGVRLAMLAIQEVTARRRLEDLRSDYIALISHDLRAPLNTIIGYTELVRLLVKSESKAKAADWTERIGLAARQMAAMIDDLVESTRLESGTLLLHKEPAFLRALILNAMAMISADEERGRIVVQPDEQPVRVWVDHKRFERLVANLLSNALKYSPAGSPVTVRLRQHAGELVLSVSDHGPGLSAETIAKLFQRFYRVDPGTRTEGMGLGLYIARLIVEAHGGRIWAESEVGQGSTFSVALPLPDQPGGGDEGASEDVHQV